MGHMDQFTEANILLGKYLRIQLAPDAPNTEFRKYLRWAGIRRFEHCVRLTAMWSQPGDDKMKKYNFLMGLLKRVTPYKSAGTKFRNPRAGRAFETASWLDRELMARIDSDD